MHLVDPKIMQQMSAPVNPIHRSIANLDQDMQAILQKTNLSDQDKVREYNQVLQRYLEYYDHVRNPIPTLPTPHSTPSQSSRSVRDEVLRTVPKTMKRKAEAVLDRIENQANMKWNDRGELIYEGELVKGSNVVDLVNDVIRHRKSFQPRGWQEFARALRQSNVPQDLVGNQERWRWMHRETATSDAFSTADETSPNRAIHPRRSKIKSPAIRRTRTRSTSRPSTPVAGIKKWIK